MLRPCATLACFALWLTDPAPAQVWSQVTGLPAPPENGNAAMAFHAARGTTVLYGGALAEFSNSNQTWEYDGVGWTLIVPPASPPPRSNHCLTYDPWRHKVVMFGGVDFTAATLFQNDTWEYDGNWSLVATAARPAPRFDARMAFDVQRRRAVLFGFDAESFGGSLLPLGLPLGTGSGGMPACNLWLAPAGIDFSVASAGGTATLPLAIPALPAFAGQRVFVQGFVFDPLAGNGLGVTTNAGLIRPF